VPSVAKTSDIVIIPLSRIVPIVLRPYSDKFTFVCECYLYRFMNGKAFVEARKIVNPTYDDVERS
jgi:hypothetical protein